MIVVICCIIYKIKCLFTDIPNHKFYINEVQLNTKTRFINIFYSLNVGSYS